MREHVTFVASALRPYPDIARDKMSRSRTCCQFIFGKAMRSILCSFIFHGRNLHSSQIGLWIVYTGFIWQIDIMVCIGQQLSGEETQLYIALTLLQIIDKFESTHDHPPVLGPATILQNQEQFQCKISLILEAARLVIYMIALLCVIRLIASGAPVSSWASACTVMIMFGSRICVGLEHVGFTHWGRDKMAAIFTDIFNCIFFNENIWISIGISLKYVPKGQINNIPPLVQIMDCCLPGDKPLSEPMMVRLSTHICVTRPQWDRDRHFSDDIFKRFFCVKMPVFDISLKCVPEGPIDNMSTLVHVMDWRRTGDNMKPIPYPMLTEIYVVIWRHQVTMS